ncbi:hypothetical protein D3C77_592500 [compost metagenome]
MGPAHDGTSGWPTISRQGLSEERPDFVLIREAPSPCLELDPGADDHVFCFQNVCEGCAGEAGGGFEFFEHLGADFDGCWMAARAVEAVPEVTACVLAADDFEFGQCCGSAGFGLARFEVFESNHGFVSGHRLLALGLAGDDRGVDATGFAAQPV